MVSQTAAPVAVDARSRGRLLQLALLAGSVLMVISNTPLAPALPQLQDAFARVSTLQISLVLTLPALVIVLVAPLAGWIADRSGRKRLLLFSTLLYGVAGSYGYVAQDMDTLLLSRALTGVAVAGVMTSVAALVADYYSGAARARFLGLQAAGMGVGNTAFLLLGGVLAEAGWRPPYLMFLAALLLIPLFSHSLYEPAHVRHEERPRESSATRQLDWRLLRLVLFCYLLVGFSQVVFYLVPLQLPFWLRDRFATSATQSGFAIGIVSFVYAVTAFVYGRRATRLAHIPLAGAAFALLGGSYLLVAAAPTRDFVYGGLILTGMALGLLLPNLNLWLANRTPQGLRGRLLGGFSAALFLGHFLSPLLLQAPATLSAMGAQWQNVGLGLMLGGGLLILLRRSLGRLLQA